MKKLLIVLVATTLSSLYAQKTCYSELKGDTLVIGNECIERKFIWNDGNLVTYSLSDKANRKTTFTVKAGTGLLYLQRYPGSFQRSLSGRKGGCD